MTSAERESCRALFDAWYMPLAECQTNKARKDYMAWFGLFMLGFDAGLLAARRTSPPEEIQ